MSGLMPETVHCGSRHNWRQSLSCDCGGQGCFSSIRQKGITNVSSVIRHSAALDNLAMGQVIYNGPMLREQRGPERSERTYFVRVPPPLGHSSVSPSWWQPCDEHGNIRPLRDFPDGFLSSHVYLPAFLA